MRLRGFQILHETIKKLSNKKDKGRALLLAPHLVKFVGQVWLKLSFVFLSTLSAGEEAKESKPREAVLEHLITAQICNMCLTMLHNLMIRGGYLQKGVKEPVVQEVLTKMLEIWRNLSVFGTCFLA